MLALVAGGRSELKAMREVSKCWNSGFEKSVTRLRFTALEPPALFSSGALAQRFPGLISLYLGTVEFEEAARRSKGVFGLKKLKTLGLEIVPGPMSVLPESPLELDAWIQQLYKPVADILANLQGLSLTSLDLQGLPLAGCFLENLKAMPLTKLSLRKTVCIVGLQLGHLRELPLTDLDLFGAQLCGGGLKPLQGLPLTSLNLGRSFELCRSASGLVHLRGLPLKSLDLDGCFYLSNEQLGSLEGLPLTFLRLRGCIQLTDDGLEHLSGLPLRTLDLSYCYQIGGPGFQHLAAAPLVRVCLYECWQVTAASVAALRRRGVIVEVCPYPSLHFEHMTCTDLPCPPQKFICFLDKLSLSQSEMVVISLMMCFFS